MDIEKEMAKLQAEARRKLDERDQGHALPPEPMDPALRVPDVDLAAFGLAGERGEEEPGAKLGLLPKLGLLLVGIITVAVLWKSVLAPIVQSLLGFLFLVLIVAGSITLFSVLRGKRDEPES